MARGYAGQVSDWNQSIDTGFAPGLIQLDRLVSGRYYFNGLNVGANAAGAVDNIRASPFYVPTPTRFDRIACSVGNAGTAAALARLGIWEVRNGVPGNLILDAGNVGADTTGEKAITIDIVLPRGWYALGANRNELAIQLRKSVTCINIGATGMFVGSPQDSWQVASAFGAFASTWGTTAYQTSFAYVVGLRAA